jgi:hypothetical protein
VSMSHEWHFSNPARSRGDRDNKSTREETERKTAVNLGLALIVIPLISLALWWASCRLSGQSFWGCWNDLNLVSAG